MLIQVSAVANQLYNPLNLGTISFMVSMIIPLVSTFVKNNLKIYLILVLITQGIILFEFIYNFLN
jgi:hypothetical protein